MREELSQMLFDHRPNAGVVACISEVTRYPKHALGQSEKASRVWGRFGPPGPPAPCVLHCICIRTGIGHNPNIEWYCHCKVGARVVGCCAHVASVLWYLGYWRHNHTQTKTPSLGYADTLQDATAGWPIDDSASKSEKEI
ncbi:uncharacterized protein TNCV_5018541 [Trichonephila clavipes]|nr:uncharacterized protein TNCV_5018541 [Trichonephila clavipes]